MVVPSTQTEKRKNRFGGEDNVSSVSHVKDEMSFRYLGGNRQEVGGYADLRRSLARDTSLDSPVPSA